MKSRCVSRSGAPCVCVSRSSLLPVCVSVTEKGTGGSLAPSQQERVVTSPATTWLHQTPSKQKSTSSSCSTIVASFTLETRLVFLHYDDADVLMLPKKLFSDVQSRNVPLPAPDAL